MTRITGKTVNPDIDQGVVSFVVQGTEYLRITGTGAISDPVGAGTVRGLRSGTFSVTSVSAASAIASVSALTAFIIPHGLASTPTLYNIQPASTQAALVPGVGAYLSADATNIYLNTIAAITANKPYSFQWEAAP